MNSRLTIAAFIIACLGMLWLAFAWTAHPPAPLPIENSLMDTSSGNTPVRDNEPIYPLKPANNLHPGKVALGRQLFFDARLSSDQSISCASCHPMEHGGADSRPLSVGVNGARGEVNAPSVLNAANNFRQFWDGRAATLEEQAAGPITNPREMAASLPTVIARLNADKAMRTAFNAIYPEGISRQGITDAIAEFERSLPLPSRFDRWLNGDHNAINSDEQNGYLLFKKHGCIACHQGVNIGGNLYQRFGVMSSYFAQKATSSRADLGRYNLTGREEDRHVFKVPSLRNIELTAPYFHDASAQTLEEAVNIMGKFQLGVELPKRDVQLIIAFLRTLTGEQAP
jgi:cytochrome c peroxidase